MKIVLTNDDGYGEPGLNVLADLARKWGKVVVVAPHTAQSGVGHQVTMNAPLQVKIGAEANHFIVHGTPADCIRLALKQIVPDADWVLAGINPGANLGSDVYQSGTVAAAREATILGTKAVALSQYIAPKWSVDWKAAADHLAKVLPMVMNTPLGFGQFWNINLPSPISSDTNLKHQFCPLDKHPHHYQFRQEGDLFHYEGVIHNRPRTAGSDVDICFSGGIAVTRMEI